MARRKGIIIQLIAGIIVGVFLHNQLKDNRNEINMCHKKAGDVLSYVQKTNEHKNQPKNSSLVFVGVLTAAKYLNTRAKAVYDTWGQELQSSNGRIMFFSSEFSHSDHLPLVALKTVDDNYPPQKKSFLMLQYIHDNFIDQFEWFFRADDDIYVRTDRLELFLRSIDSRKLHYIGQAGRGNNEEIGTLSLDYDENFCMGGPGVILSRETLKKIAPHIKDCLKNFYTTHEDVELGRCVKQFAGISCTWSYEMQTILYHNQSGESAFTGSLKLREVHRAITLHPVKNPQHLYRIHNYFKALKIQELQQTGIKLHRIIASASIKLKEKNINIANILPPDAPKGSSNYFGNTSIIGTDAGLNRYQPKKFSDVLVWDFISKSYYTHTETNPRRKIDAALQEGLNDVVREFMENINKYSKQRGRIIDFREVLYGYRRLNVQHGVDWVLDMLLVYRKYRGHKMTVPVRRHAYLQQTFTGIEVREIPISGTNENELNPAFEFLKIRNINLLPSLFNKKSCNEFSCIQVNFILPLSGRLKTFRRFMYYFEEIFFKNNEKVSLTIIIYPSFEQSSDYVNTAAIINDLKAKYKTMKSSLSIIPVLNKPFSRGEALQIGSHRFKDEDLLFFIDVDIIFSKDILTNSRINTVKRSQVYFPIIFSQYNPIFANNYTNISCDAINTEYKQIVTKNITAPFKTSENAGYWRHFGYGIVSVYKCDLDLVGGFNTTLKGWGLEDVTLYEKFVNSNITIFRSCDPSLMHVYHKIKCVPEMEPAQREMCLGSRANTLGSWTNLQEYVLTNL